MSMPHLDIGIVFLLSLDAMLEYVFISHISNNIWDSAGVELEKYSGNKLLLVPKLSSIIYHLYLLL